ncbi:lactate utilization protein [Clostridium oceanicum]|uniref:Lactate utilization protein n=1 Tax=Clostridium oceanicum TaxID=1543 RepID=A0ABN1JIA5_9CLOT
MDNNAKFVVEKKVERTIKSLEENNMEGYYVEDEKELIDKVKELANKGDMISVGGSMTLFETGIIDLIRNGDYNFLDRYKEGLTPKDIKDLYRKSFYADTYITSTNAVTEDGELYNVDGTGNRVASMIYGPDQVIVIVGTNKIVKDVDEAIERNREIAAPANAKRLNRATPCAKVGYCMDCKSKDRICNDYVLIRRQGNKGRIKVIIVGKQLGY